jgi:small neutral amino acid transporter SnatA (MarC family)
VNGVINFGLLSEVVVTLFVIMDPPGTVPVFISLTAGQSRAVRKKAAWQAVLVAFSVGIIAIHIVMWLTLRFSGIIMRILGENGVLLVTRIAGLLLSAIAVQLVADAVTDFIKAG